MAITRKTEKNYPKVEFEVELFEGSFVLPRFDSLPIGVIRRITEGDFNAIADFISQHGDEDVLEAFDSLSGDELETFMTAWTGAENIPGPKSQKSKD